MLLKEKACYAMIGLFCLSVHFSQAQDQRLADSLKIIYTRGQFADSTKLELLKQLSFNELNDLNLKLKYAQELINSSLLAKNDKSLFHGYYATGNAYKLKGDLEKALASFFTSLEIAKKITYPNGEGTAYMAVADVYSNMGNFSNSEDYYARAIDILRQEDANGELNLLASALLNAGDDAILNKKYDKALGYFEESMLIYKRIDSKIGYAYNLGNVGIVYAEMGKDSVAEQNINEAIGVLEEIKDYYPISVYLTYMSDIYLRKNEYKTALAYAQKSLELAQKHNLKEQISDANLKLAELYEKAGDYKESNSYLKNHYAFRDSVLNIEAVEKMANLRTNYEVSQKQSEVDLLNEKQRNQRITVIATIIALVLIASLAVGLFRRNRFIQKTSAIIQVEKDRSDELLLNILPSETAQELKEKGKVKAKRYDSVSVLFTDFKGFTAYSTNLSPEELVESVNYYYSKFDEIMEKHGLEKIKTVGDAYMAAGGLPFPLPDHALKMVEAAIEIVKFVQESKKNDPDDMTRFDIRVGINSGPVVAGVVGTKKFAYDIWGDTVNIASRMESNSEPGRINISENTYQLIKHQYTCSFRGELEAKNKGKLRMYFVEHI